MGRAPQRRTLGGMSPDRIATHALDVEIAGLGDDAVDYLAAWDLQRRVHAEVVGGRATRHRAAARAPAGLHRRQAHRAARASGRPGGAPVIDVDRGGKITFHGPGQLVGYPIVRLPDHVKVVDYVRRVEEALIAVCADLGVTTARVPGRSGVWLRARRARPRAQGRRDRDPGQPGRDHARLRPQLRRRPGLVRPLRPVRHRRRRASPRSAAELGRDVTIDDVLPSVRRHLATYLAWQPYDATPDYDARPEPGRGPRIELVRPGA